MYRIGTKGRRHTEETKQNMRDAYRRRVEAKNKKERMKPKDLRQELADYLGLNPVKKVSEAPQEAPDATKEENTKVCV